MLPLLIVNLQYFTDEEFGNLKNWVIKFGIKIL